MKLHWDIEHVYFYLVSFVAMILLIIGTVILAQTAIAYLTPIPTDDYSYFDDNLRQDWEAYLGPATFQQEQERYKVIAARNEQRNLLSDLISALAYITIALPVYLYHWRKIPKLEGV